MKSGTMNAVLMIGAAMFFAACGSGGSSGGNTPTVASPISGKFVDSTVNGLHYTSPPSNPAGGLTNNGGQYQCMPGDKVTFDLGGRTIGAAQDCGPLATAVSVFGATSVLDPRVVALAQLLLTLNTGTDPIQLPAPIPAGLPNPLNFSDPNFTAVLTTALPATTIVTARQAAAHLATSFMTLSVTIVNSGTVTSNPVGINCTAGTCSYDFLTGTGVTLTATGTGFTGWSGGCLGTGTCAVTLNANAAVTATFPVAPPPATLQISTTTGTGTGTVTCNANGGGFGACVSSYPNGTVLVLQATADAGSTFTGWSNGTGSVRCTGTANCSVTLNADSTVTANFTLNITQLSVTGSTTSANGNGGGGTVQCSASGGGTGPCGSYPVGTRISMIATPNSASNFTGWSGGTGSATICNATTGNCDFTLNNITTVTANFNRPTLSVVLAGTGSVSSNPLGITCGATCSAVFNKGTSITLTASGAGFTGWSGGGCSGTSTCPVTLTIDMTVTANFGQVTTSSRWLFYTNNNNGAIVPATIRYVDPANPGATTATLTTAAYGLNREITATWDSTNAAYTNLTMSYLTYFSGGKLWRVSAAKSSGVPGSPSNPPVQISNETAANQICHVDETGATLLSGGVKLIYLLPGAGGCAGTANVTKLVGILDDVNTPPTTLPSGLDWSLFNNGPGWVTDLSTGAATYMLLTDLANNNTLKLLNLSTNAITLIQANVGDADIVAQDTSDRVFLRGGPAKTILYLYTISTNSLVTLVTGASSLEKGNPTGDGTNLYVAEQATGKLYNIPMSATGPSNVGTLLASVRFPLGDPYGGDDVVVTTNNVFLHTYVPCSGGCTPPNAVQDASGLYRIPKSGGSATPIIAHATGTDIFDIASVKDLLYYNHAVAAPQANIIKEDGTAVFSSPASCFPCSGWSAKIHSPSFFVRTQEQPLSKKTLGTFAASTAGTWNGVTLTAFEAATGTQGATLGVVPATTPTLAAVYGDDFIDTTALFVGAQNGSSNTFLFFVDTVLAGSLTQVPTGTPAQWLPAD